MVLTDNNSFNLRTLLYKFPNNLLTAKKISDQIPNFQCEIFHRNCLKFSEGMWF